MTTVAMIVMYDCKAMLQIAAYLTIIIYNPILVSLALGYTTNWFYRTGHCHNKYPEWLFTFGNTAKILPHPIPLSTGHSVLKLKTTVLTTPITYFRIQFMDPLIYRSLDQSAALAPFYIKLLCLYHR